MILRILLEKGDNMDQYYQNLYATVAYHWIGNFNHAKKGKTSRSICFCKNNRHGKISFFDDNIIELTIEETHTKENLFYLHFEIKNMKMLVDHIDDFFRCFNQSKQSQEKQNCISFPKHQLNILLTCTTGLTTSYYGYLLKDYFQQNHLDINIDAVGYQDLERRQSQYDYIFVAPQIAYRYIDLHERYGDKVFLIDSYDFATGNIESVLKDLKEK